MVVRENARQLRVRGLVGLVAHAPAVVVKPPPDHLTEHDDCVTLSSVGDEFDRYLLHHVFDRSGSRGVQAFDTLHARGQLGLPGPMDVLSCSSCSRPRRPSTPRNCVSRSETNVLTAARAAWCRQSPKSGRPDGRLFTVTTVDRPGVDPSHRVIDGPSVRVATPTRPPTAGFRNPSGAASDSPRGFPPPRGARVPGDGEARSKPAGGVRLPRPAGVFIRLATYFTLQTNDLT